MVDRTNRVIGTATAWLDPDHHGELYGQIHWVAIHPEQQGRGLAKPLMSRACAALRELGHDKAYLATSTGRIPAICLYLHFGFRPEITKPEDDVVWNEMKQYIPSLTG